MADHTPGDWIARRSEYPPGISGAAHYVMPPGFNPNSRKNEWPMPIAQVSLSSADCEANFSLLLAAPKLFEACCNYLYGRKEARECEAEMRAAIAKVNGGGK